MPIAHFERKIQELNFSFISEKGTSGVLLTQNYESLSKAISAPDILFALETAKNKFGADAVYFRYFQDSRAAVPQLYIFDYTLKPLSSQEKNRIHRNMWNGYQVPVYIIIEKSSVSFFDAREKPDYNRINYAQEIIIKTGEAIRNFNAQSFDNGLFWEEEINKNHFQFEQSATKDLIRGLKEVYASFQKESGLDKHVALKLLVQCLLIKYLEERDEDSQSGYFASTYFQKHFQCNGFCDVIRQGKLLDLLDKLASDFNGKIFQWDKEKEVKERTSIRKTEIKYLANYLDANIENNQYVFWRLYSFSHLPVEVISSVHEELLTDSKDIVYTPEMIVSTLVDECMPLQSPQKDFKLIDVSCGSGIFLVKAYKRIVQWWRYEQWQKTGKLEKPSLPVLKDLLLKSIHGVDIEQDAIRLSIFSLALAILDEVNLDSPTWGELKFPDLNNNIITKNFFKYVTENPPNDFSLVIGNPPFNLPFVNDKEPARKEYFKKLEKQFGYKTEIDIPDENPALHFLVQSMKLLKAGGILSMIQPSGPLLYQKDLKFKEDVFSTYNLLQVIDFTKLADKLWGKKNVSTAAVFLQKSRPDSEPVLHLIANRTFSNANKLFLEFDYYDFHFMSKNDAIFKPYTWKAHLLGGGRITSLIERLSTLPTLKEFLKEKERKEGWCVGIGYIIGDKSNKADFITGKETIPVEALTENGIDEKQIHECLIQRFERPRKTKKKIYEGPHILIRVITGNQGIPIAYSEKYLTFPFGIIGIHAPQDDKSELSALYDYLKENNSLLRSYILATSGRAMIGKATSINKDDIMRIPYSHNKNDIIFSEAEKIIIEEIADKRKTEEIAVLNADITKFASVFCKTLNSVYQIDNGKFQPYKILNTENYIAIHFEYGKELLTVSEEQVFNLEQYIQNVIPQKNIKRPHTHIQKIMKVYGKNTIILIKPKQLRYWLPSIALRDADEVFADYIKARY